MQKRLSQMLNIRIGGFKENLLGKCIYYSHYIECTAQGIRGDHAFTL